MKKLLTLMLILTIILKLNAQPNTAHETKSENLAGLWSLVAVENFNPDGGKTLPYGENPVGLLMLNESGSYAIQILKSSRPKIAAGDKNKATPEENTALVQGNNSHFGTYSVDDKLHKISFRVETAFYPNWEGTIQERSYTLKDDELKYIVTNTTNGGAVTASVVWRRKK